MKYGIIKILLFLSFVGTVFAGATLFYFNARSDGDNIKLEWQSQNEVNLSKYIIQRRTASTDFYTNIETIQPRGNNTYYEFTDKSAYKTQDLILIYRLEIVDLNNTISHTSDVTVSHSISGVKRTWGSIKAMFR